jgi:hypothetical protein
MSALLVWCLRILEDAPADRPLTRHRRHPPPPAPADIALAWLDPATHQPPRSRQLLSAASLIVTAYLTGMRADEVLALRRGCCTPAAPRRLHHPRPHLQVRRRQRPRRRRRPRTGAPVGGHQARRRRHHRMENCTTPRSSSPPACSDAPDRPPSMTHHRRPTPAGSPSRHSSAGPTPGPANWAGTTRPSPRTPTEPSACAACAEPSPGSSTAAPAAGSPSASSTATSTPPPPTGTAREPRSGCATCSPWKKPLALSDTLPRRHHLEAQPTVSGPAASRYRAAVEQYTARYAGVSLTHDRQRRWPGTPRCASTTAPDRSSPAASTPPRPCAVAGPRRPSPRPPRT